MTLRLNRGIPLCATFVIAAASQAQTATEKPKLLNLAQAIKIAISQQPDLAAAKAQELAARALHQQAQAAYWPSLSLDFSTNDSYSNTLPNSSTTIQGTSATRQADVILSYNIMDSGQRVATEQNARATSKAYQFNTANQRLVTISNAATYYYEALKQTELVKVQEATVERTKATYEMTADQAKEGISAQKDILQAQADYETAKVTLLTAQNTRNVAYAQLKQALGISTEIELSLEDVNSSNPAFAQSTSSLTELIKSGFTNRPDVLQAQQTVEALKASVRLAKAKNSLTISVDSNLSAVFLQNQSNTRAISISASLPLFNGGANTSAIKQAEMNAKAAEAQLASARLTAKLEIETAYRTLENAKASVPAALTALTAAEINYKSASESRKEGIGTVVDVITAQAQLVQAQTNYVQALYTLYTADVSLQKSIGNAESLLGDNI